MPPIPFTWETITFPCDRLRIRTPRRASGLPPQKSTGSCELCTTMQQSRSWMCYSDSNHPRLGLSRRQLRTCSIETVSFPCPVHNLRPCVPPPTCSAIWTVNTSLQTVNRSLQSFLFNHLLLQSSCQAALPAAADNPAASVFLARRWQQYAASVIHAECVVGFWSPCTLLWRRGTYGKSRLVRGVQRSSLLQLPRRNPPLCFSLYGRSCPPYTMNHTIPAPSWGMIHSTDEQWQAARRMRAQVRAVVQRPDM